MNIKSLSYIGLISMGLLLVNFTAPVQAANFTVNIAADDADAHDANPGDGVCSDALGDCTLRAAIEEANALAGADVILFASTFVDAILVLDANEGPLPVISTQVFILGYGITAYNSTATLLRDAPPQFTIDGSQLSSGNGFLFSGAGASGGVVSALGIINFPSDGVVMALGADNISVNRSYIGIHPDGTPAGNGAHGINAVITDGHHIGKTRHSSGTHFVSLGNVISANGGSGIRLFNSNDNTVNANLIGLAASGTSDRGNDLFGIDMSGNNNQIGDFINNSLAGNFLAANDSGGMRIDGDNNRVYSNQLGKGETGSFINSEGDGVLVYGELNFIGNNGNASNKIYEHVGAGIRVGLSTINSGDNNFIINNTIGSAGNISALLRSGNDVGITTNGNTNLIQNNRVINSEGLGHGIFVSGNNTTVVGNQVGFVNSINGPSAEPNVGVGVFVVGDNSIIGSEINPNFIGGNGLSGIQVNGKNIRVAYNHIGVDDSFRKIGNSQSGMVIFNEGSGLEINNNIIGDNGGTGVYLIGDVNVQQIHHNYIGVAPDESNIGNDVSGIIVASAINASVWRNHIANNGGDGISVVNDSEGIAIYQNYMYNNGRLGIELGDDGITDNDPGDFDEGDNRLQNTPVIEAVIFDQMAVPPTLTISYRVDSNSSAATYPMNIDFYWSAVDEVAQGRYFLTTDTNYTTPNALKTFTVNFTGAAMGGYLTATALDGDSNTSEMAPKFQFGEVDLIFKDGFEGE